MSIVQIIDFHHFKFNKGFFKKAFITFIALSASNATKSQGIQAFQSTRDDLVNYLPVVSNLIYAIACIIALVTAFVIYIELQNNKPVFSKKVMALLGSCIWLIVSVQTLPLFFGLSNNPLKEDSSTLSYTNLSFSVGSKSSPSNSSDIGDKTVIWDPYSHSTLLVDTGGMGVSVDDWNDNW